VASEVYGLNTHIFKEDWAATLQEELDQPTIFKQIARVDYTNTKVLNNPYLTDPSVSTLSPGTPYSFSALVRTNESVDIDQHQVVPNFIDRMTLGISGYDSQMEVAKRQAVLLNEAIETALYGDHAACTDFGLADLTTIGSADTATITVSATNVDDIITGIVATIRANNGETVLNRHGGFIVWRPQDFQYLQTFAMANGFNTADSVLVNGIQQGFFYGGLAHFTSNLLAANHLLAGVKNMYHLGIYSGTYGQIVVDDKDPNLQSGISVVSRVDYQEKVWTKSKPVLFDINVA